MSFNSWFPIQSVKRGAVCALWFSTILVLGVIPTRGMAQIRIYPGRFEVTPDSLKTLYAFAAQKKPVIVIDSTMATLENFKKLSSDTIVTMSFFKKTDLIMKRLIARYGPEAENGVLMIATGPMAPADARITLGGSLLSEDSLKVIYDFVAKQKPAIVIQKPYAADQPTKPEWKLLTFEEFRKIDVKSWQSINFWKYTYLKQQYGEAKMKKEYGEQIVNGLLEIYMPPSLQ